MLTNVHNFLQEYGMVLASIIKQPIHGKFGGVICTAKDNDHSSDKLTIYSFN